MSYDKLPTQVLSSQIEHGGEDYGCQPCDNNDVRRTLRPLGVHGGLEEQDEQEWSPGLLERDKRRRRAKWERRMNRKQKRHMEEI